MDAFFPFIIRGNSYYNDNSAGGVFSFKNVFRENKPETIRIVEQFGSFQHSYNEVFSYYCFDVIVHSPVDVEFVCFDMNDFLYGGRGKKFHNFNAVCSKDLTDSYINSRLLNRAEDRRKAELEAQEARICFGYAQEEKEKLGL